LARIRSKVSRFAVALGGILILIGVVFISAFIFSLFGLIKPTTLLESDYLRLALLVLMFVMGLFDVLAGVMFLVR